MKILFLIPPSKKIPERIYGCSYQLYSQPELPILYAASLIQKSGFEVDFRDFTLEDNSEKSFKKFLKDSQYDVYIFHSVLLSKEIDLKASKEIREINKDAFIIFFGPEPTRVPKDFLFDERCFVVRGEAEITIRNLAEKLRLKQDVNIKELKGISYFKNMRLHLNESRFLRNPAEGGTTKGSYFYNKEIIDNPTFGIIENLNDLPFPARNLAKKYENKYYNSKIPQKPHNLILTSRGCVFKCSFCVPNAISWARELEWKKWNKDSKPPLKLRSVENIVREFKQLAEYGYKSIWVMDDMFLWGKERSLNILKGIKGLNIELGVLARADFIDEDIVKALKQANCKVVAMGAESFCQEVLNYIKKDLKVESIYKAVNLLKKEGIVPEINLMFGNCPLETKEKIKEAIEKAIELDVKYVLFSIATPFPGTELKELAEKNKWLIKEKYNNITKSLDPSSKSMLCFPNLSAQDLEKLLRYAKRRFYFRPKYIWWRLKEIKSLTELIILIKTALKLLK